MKKNYTVKHFCFSHIILPLVILAGFPVLFSSCSKQINNKKYQKLKDFAFYQLVNNQNKKSLQDKSVKYFYSPELNVFFLRHQIDANGIRYLIEVNNPEYTGLLEGLDFYSEYMDDGEWIEKVLSEIEENNFDDLTISRPFNFVSTENGYEIGNVDTVVKRWISSNRRLNTMHFENEVFVPLNKDDIYVLINSTDNLTTRAFYSQDFLLQKKEYWNITNVLESTVFKTEEYFYDENTKNISQKIISTSDSSVVTLYNSNKLPVRVDVYNLDGDNKFLKTRTLWRYTSDGKISIEESTEFFYKNNNYKEYTDKLTKRQSYIYKGKEETPPDYKYYENGILKMKTVYQDKGNFTTQIYFDDGYSVQSVYENNIRKKDVYLMDGIIRRVKEYE